MKVATIISLCSLFVGSLTIFILFLSTPQYIQRGNGKVASNEIKAAMRKMGPMKNYRILLPEERLQVLVKGKWLYLRY